MRTATISEYQAHLPGDGSEATGPVIYRVYCPGGDENTAHDKVYEGKNRAAAHLAYHEHAYHVQRIDGNVAFMFTTVAERHEVQGRFMEETELRRTHGGRKSRVYVRITEDDVPMPCPPYGSEHGDESAEDEIWKKYNRLEVKAMKDKADSSVYDALVEGGYLATYTKFSFSRKAGCGCGCSLGLIATGQIRAGTDDGWVTPDGARHVTISRPVDVWIS